MPKSTGRSSFKMPRKVNISGRTSTITNSFAQAIIPRIRPSEEECQSALSVLGMSANNMECSYCGSAYELWDHLNPIVHNKRPTGFITEIANLIPSCKTCNESKSGSPWKQWLFGAAANSPGNRGVSDIKARAARIGNYEDILKPRKVEFERIVNASLWSDYWMEREEIELALRQAQTKADIVWKSVEEHLDAR